MRLTFGDCVFDSGTREISRGADPADLSPKAFRLLEILIGRRPNAVSKDELHQLLWPNTFVADANLPNLVAEVRVALGDDARPPRVIRTVQRFGYAFHAEARSLPASSPPATGLACRLEWGDREISLSEGENVLGRDPEVALWIDLNSVSRRHARIVVDGTTAVLEDLGSRNGTYVAGRRISTPVQLANGDRIKIGGANLVFRSYRDLGTTKSEISSWPR